MDAFPTSMIPDSTSNSSECLACRTKLLLYPGTIHPRAVTEMLRVEPTKELVAGNTWTTSQGKVKLIKFSGWFLISKHEITSLDLSDHVDWLLARLGPAMDGLLTLQRMDGVIMRLEFVWWGSLGRGGPTIKPDQLRVLAKLGLELSLSVCYYGDE